MLSNSHGESVLDRAAVRYDVPDENEKKHHSVNDNAISMSKQQRFKGKVRSLLHVHNDRSTNTGNEDELILAASPDVTSTDARLDESLPPVPGPQGFKQLVHHPVDTIKAKTERKTNKEVAANLLSPEITHAQDVELIRAQESLDNATTEEEKLQACDDLESLKKARQDLFVRWTMDRHVMKLKRLEKNDGGDRDRSGSDGQTNSQLESIGWKSYGQQVCSYMLWLNRRDAPSVKSY